MNGRRVLVTGSSRGIGRAIALELGKQGWNVIVHYTAAAEEASSVKEELGAQCAGILRADLSKPGEAVRLWNEAESLGQIQALVCNAGIYEPGKMLDMSDEEFERIYSRTFAINWDSPLRMIRAAAKSFASRGGGKILSVASRVGFRGESGAALYSASKAALINLTRAMAVELAEKNIRVFCIAPGWVETAMAREGMENRLPQILKDIPLGRMASPEDCAAAAAFLLSDGADYLSGITIDINGASYFH